jgi:hypothetical protein
MGGINANFFSHVYMGTKINMKCTNSYLLDILGFSIMADSDVSSCNKVTATT